MSTDRELKAVLRPDDSVKLRILAAWLDVDDKKKGKSGTEAQDDLRRIAEWIDAEFRPRPLLPEGGVREECQHVWGMSIGGSRYWCSLCGSLKFWNDRIRKPGMTDEEYSLLPQQREEKK